MEKKREKKNRAFCVLKCPAFNAPVIAAITAPAGTPKKSVQVITCGLYPTMEP